MTNLLDTENEGIEDPESDRREDSKELEFIERLIDKAIQVLEDDSYEPRIQDALKAIQLKEKLSDAKSVGVAKTSEGEKAFWDMIEEVRQEELPKLYPESEPEPVDLESQIINTIKGLNYQVKNGALPVKTITDYFNYGKSEESRLSYHRVGRILSNLGFRKAMTHNGSYAILWDDNLLLWQASSQSANEPSDFEEDEKEESESPASPVSPVSPASPVVTLPAPQVRGWRSS
jgi:hypothetical protein